MYCELNLLLAERRGGQGQHPARAGQGLEEAVDDNHEVRQVAVQQQQADTVLGLLVGQVERGQLAGEVLSAEEEAGLDHVTAHGERLVEERRGELEDPVNVRTVPGQNTEAGVLPHGGQFPVVSLRGFSE